LPASRDCPPLNTCVCVVVACDAGYVCEWVARKTVVRQSTAAVETVTYIVVCMCMRVRVCVGGGVGGGICDGSGGGYGGGEWRLRVVLVVVSTCVRFTYFTSEICVYDA
jgi:hypothetical protein